jgi:hypothetical protein
MAVVTTSGPSRKGLPALLLEFSRPFTLVAPALGFLSGAATAYGAAPRETWHTDLIVYPAIGALMAAVLNAASNALNQIYDLEIDRVNKPKRPLTSGRLSMRDAWLFTVCRVRGGAGARLAGGARRTARVLLAGARRHDHHHPLLVPPAGPSASASGPTSRSRFRAACC